MIDSINTYMRLDSLEWIFMGIAFLFLLSGCVCVMAIFMSRLVKSYYAKREDDLKAAFNPILSSIAINESMSDGARPGAAVSFYLDHLRKIIGGSRFAKEVLIQRIVNSKKNLTGRSAATLTQVYRELGLEKMSVSKLRSLAWNKQAKGIRELAEMHSVTSIPRIHRYLKSRNQTLREEAVMALVRLDENHPLFFLDDYHRPLTSWMRLNIFHHLQKFDQRKLPPFSRWFQHPNKTVVIFSLNMTRQFRQREAIPHLVNLLNTTDDDLLALAVDALGELDAYEHADFIAALAEKHHGNAAIESQVARCLGKIGTPLHIPVLVKLIENGNHQVRFEAMKSIKKLDESALLNLQVTSGSNLLNTLKHLQEPLLQ